MTSCHLQEIRIERNSASFICLISPCVAIIKNKLRSLLNLKILWLYFKLELYMQSEVSRPEKDHVTTYMTCLSIPKVQKTGKNLRGLIKKWQYLSSFNKLVNECVTTYLCNTEREFYTSGTPSLIFSFCILQSFKHIYTVCI